MPKASWVDTAYTILATGKVAAAADYRIERERYPGQDILYCLSGRGFVRSENRTLPVGANQLVWIANESPHAHWPARDTPWTVLWCRIDGPDPIACRRNIFSSDAPLVTCVRGSTTASWFDRVFDVFRQRRSRFDFALNQLVGELFVAMETDATGNDEQGLPTAVVDVMQRMRSAPELPWRSSDLSRVTGYSPAHLRRLFRRHLQTNPRQFLRRQRLMLAQKLLLGTHAHVSEIAERCGFCDVYHFSREFRRATGISPSAWRKSEIGAPRNLPTAP